MRGLWGDEQDHCKKHDQLLSLCFWENDKKKGFLIYFLSKGEWGGGEMEQWLARILKLVGKWWKGINSLTWLFLKAGGMRGLNHWWTTFFVGGQQSYPMVGRQWLIYTVSTTDIQTHFTVTTDAHNFLMRLYQRCGALLVLIKTAHWKIGPTLLSISMPHFTITWWIKQTRHKNYGTGKSAI